VLKTKKCRARAVLECKEIGKNGGSKVSYMVACFLVSIRGIVKIWSHLLNLCFLRRESLEFGKNCMLITL